MNPSLSIVLCSFGRPDAVLALLDQVLLQLPSDGEVCVVDQTQGPQAGRVAAAVTEMGDVRVQCIERPPGLAAARNAGIAATRGTVVLFFDDDVVLSPGCIDGHLQVYARPNVGGVVGRIQEQRLRGNARKRTNRVGLSGRVHVNLDVGDSGPIQTLKGCNMSFRRSALGAAGPFDPAYAGTAFLEDADMSVRVTAAGWSLWYEADARVLHRSDPTGGVRPANRIEQEWWRFHNTGRFVRRHRRAPSLLVVAPSFAAIAVKRALEWRSISAPVHLMGALWAGWSAGAS